MGQTGGPSLKKQIFCTSERNLLNLGIRTMKARTQTALALAPIG